MKPATAIAMLDRQLAAHGQTVTVTKYGVTPASVKALVRAAKEDELAGLSGQQVWWKVVLSPTGLTSVLPLAKGDTVKINGKSRAVELYAPIVMADELVRVELMVAG